MFIYIFLIDLSRKIGAPQEIILSRAPKSDSHFRLHPAIATKLGRVELHKRDAVQITPQYALANKNSGKTIAVGRK